MIRIRSDYVHYGVLLVNAGAPEEPQVHAVKQRLSKYLMDVRIAPINRIAWWLIVHLGILPKQANNRVEYYQKNWTLEGSLYELTHRKLQKALTQSYGLKGLNVSVLYGMNYSSPSIQDSLKEFKDLGCDRLIILPLYPQYAYSTTGSVHDSVSRGLRRINWEVPCDFIEEYHDNPVYIQAIAASILNAGFKPNSNDKLLFAYETIALNDIENGDRYELQVGASSLQIASELGIERNQWTIGYIPRIFKCGEWLHPSTQNVLSRWVEAKVERVFVVCPNYAVECFETHSAVEHGLKSYYYSATREVGRRPVEDSFLYIESLDRSRAHLKVLLDVLKPHIEGGKNG